MQTDHALAQLLVYAYAGPPDVDAGADARAVFHEFPDELVVVVPGTVSALGWVRDFEWLPYPDPILGRCHGGFLRNGLALWARVKPRVLLALAAGKSVTYAGHSLGGAEAQICAALHVAFGWKPPRLVTFGSPRIALWIDRQFRTLLKSVNARLYKRAGDPVPHVPPIWWFGHVRTNIILGSVLPGSNPSWPFDPVNDQNHGIVHYLDDLSHKG
jgi:hypothetical protein